MPQNQEILKPVTAEDINKATETALQKGQRLGNSNMAKLDILQNITVDQFNYSA